MPTTSRTFGHHPRNALRNNWCGTTRLADGGTLDALLAAAAGAAARAYARYNPTLYARHVRLASGVRAEWRLGETPFTSGIVNRDNGGLTKDERQALALSRSSFRACRSPFAGSPRPRSEFTSVGGRDR